MDSYGGRLYHSPLVKGHGGGEGSYLGGVHGKIFTGRPSGLKAHNLQLLAQVILPVGTGITFAAEDLGFNCNLLVRGKAHYAGAQPLNTAGDLMALCNGVFRKGMLAVVHMDVGSADPDADDLHQYLPWAGLRDGNFLKFNYARGGHNLLKHRRSPPVWCYRHHLTPGGEKVKHNHAANG